MTAQNIDVVNPEALLEQGYTYSKLFSDLTDTEIVAKVQQATVPDIARLLSEYQEVIETSLVKRITNVLSAKINKATADELEAIVDECNAIGKEVWLIARPYLMIKNNQVADSIRSCATLQEMEKILIKVAKINGPLRWVPKPVYLALKECLEPRIAIANLTQLDQLAQMAHRWRQWHDLSPAIKKRDKELLGKASVYQQYSGYVVQSEAKKLLIDEIRTAIRMVEDEDQGFEFVKPKAS